MEYTLRIPGEKPTFCVFGCGGTGAYVAEGLCRLTINSGNTIYLIDPDRVEERNVGRQNFYPEDIGKFKVQVLAERFSWQFKRRIHYLARKVEHINVAERGNINIGCVDNASAREMLQWAGYRMMAGRFSYQHFGGWYIDAGNAEDTGQVLIGNSFPRELSQAFQPASGRCDKLPLPTVQQPGLLVPVPEPQPDCAEGVEMEEQSPVINRMMADLVLVFVHKLLANKLHWMGAYIDIETGTLSTVNATPGEVARITGHTVRSLEYRPRKQKGYGE